MTPTAVGRTEPLVARGPRRASPDLPERTAGSSQQRCQERRRRSVQERTAGCLHRHGPGPAGGPIALRPNQGPVGRDQDPAPGSSTEPDAAPGRNPSPLRDEAKALADGRLQEARTSRDYVAKTRASSTRSPTTSSPRGAEGLLAELRTVARSHPGSFLLAPGVAVGRLVRNAADAAYLPLSTTYPWSNQ